MILDGTLEAMQMDKVPAGVLLIIFVSNVYEFHYQKRAGVLDF
jgi:hypothetical protein